MARETRYKKLLDAAGFKEVYCSVEMNKLRAKANAMEKPLKGSRMQKLLGKEDTHVVFFAVNEYATDFHDEFGGCYVGPPAGGDKFKSMELLDLSPPLRKMVLAPLGKKKRKRQKKTAKKKKTRKKK